MILLGCLPTLLGLGTESLQSAFRLSKSVAGAIGLDDVYPVGQPIQQRDDRICAHIFIAQLALLLLRELRHRLNEKAVSFSPKEALAAVKSIEVAELDLNGEKQVEEKGDVMTN